MPPQRKRRRGLARSQPRQKQMHLTAAPGTTNGSARFSLTRWQDVAKPELGSKRQCQNCGAKFYDLNKDPILCPKCGTVFQAVAVRGGRAEVVPNRPVEDEEVEPDTAAGPELVSLDEVEADEAEKEIPIDGVEIEDDIAEDDTFLEEEEEGDDDVADLIDGDIEDDEEV